MRPLKKNEKFDSVVGGGAIARIKSIDDKKLSKSHRKIKEYILFNHEKIIEMSVSNLANACDVSEATVIRFCQTFKFEGFQELKLKLAQELNYLDKINIKISKEESLREISIKLLNYQIHLLKETIKKLDINQIKSVVEKISVADKILFVGMGSSGSIAREASNMFLRFGFNVDYIPDPHIANLKSSMLTQDDIIVGLSSSGSTKDTVQCLSVANDNEGPYKVAITSYMQSPITKEADAVLLTSSFENPIAGGTLWSNLSQQYVINLLFLCTLSKKENLNDTVIKAANSVVDKLY